MSQPYRRIALVMAGGSGERFWPLSRKARPKQLLRLADPDKNLLQQTAARLEPMVGNLGTYVATAPHLIHPTRRYLAQVPDENIFAEPHKRNTAGCLVWAVASILAADPMARERTSMAVLAADHRIEPDEGFRATVDAALTVAETEGGIVTIGIRPNRAETGYGYIELDDSPTLGTERVPVHGVTQFREKPDAETAAAYVASGRYLWNSGTFFWTLETFLGELASAAPDHEAKVHEIAALLGRGEASKAADAFAELNDVSIDYALMEKARKVFVAEAAFEWDDVGSWDALDRSVPRDAQGNIEQGHVIALDTRDSILVNDSEDIVACVTGLDNLVVVVTKDAVLVCPKERAQDVKGIVQALKERGIDRT